MESAESDLMSQSNMRPPSSGSKNKTSKKLPMDYAALYPRIQKSSTPSSHMFLLCASQTKHPSTGAKAHAYSLRS
jgi:hypothetical protein